MEIYEKHPNIDLRHVHFVFVQEFTMHKRCRMCDTFVHIECVIFDYDPLSCVFTPVRKKI